MEEIKILSFRGAGSLLFSDSPVEWSNILQESPIEKKGGNSIRYVWRESGIARTVYSNGNSEVTFSKIQKKLSFNNIYLFEEDKEDVHKKMCTLDKEPKYDLGYTHLFNLGVCLIDFYHKSGSGDSRVVSVFTKGVYDESDEDLILLNESDW